MRVVVTLGRTKLEFKARSNRKGIVEWNQGDEVRNRPDDVHMDENNTVDGLFLGM